MRQPTFFAQAWPRFDHHVYWSGRGSTRRNTSTKPSSSKTRVSQARSSGRKPEFFWLLRQFLRSICWCAMFQSPHSTISLRPALQRGQVRQERLEETELGRLPVRARRARGQVEADDDERRRSRPRGSGPRRRTRGWPKPVRTRAGCRRVEGDAGVAFLLRRVECRVRAAGRAHRARHVVDVGLDFLQADDVPGLAAGEPVRQALAVGRADAVDIERDDAHGIGGGELETAAGKRASVHAGAARAATAGLRRPGTGGGPRVPVPSVAARIISASRHAPVGRRDDRFSPGIPRLRTGTRRASFRGIRHQGGAPQSIFFQHRVVQRRRQPAPSRPVLRRGVAGFRNRLHAALRSRLQGHHPCGGDRDRACRKWAESAVQLQPEGSEGPRRRRSRRRGAARGPRRHRRRRHQCRHLGPGVGGADRGAGSARRPGC